VATEQFDTVTTAEIDQRGVARRSRGDAQNLTPFLPLPTDCPRASAAFTVTSDFGFVIDAIRKRSASSSVLLFRTRIKPLAATARHGRIGLTGRSPLIWRRFASSD
jgi:hypothetical protein